MSRIAALILHEIGTPNYLILMLSVLAGVVIAIIRGERNMQAVSVLVAIGMMAAIVYATRLGGYLVGLQLRHITWLRPIPEALPGCAFMAILRLQRQKF